MRLLVTGATGFVGGAVLTNAAANPQWQTRIAVRGGGGLFPDGVESVLVEGLGPQASWRGAVQGVDVIVHAAARAHVMRESAIDPLAEYRHINVAGTLRLARQAAEAGVRRFVFISSVKVNGEATSPGEPFTADDIPAPRDFYGISKHEAEIGLKELAARTGLEVVILRPVLVYGPGVKANFRAVLRWLRRGVPLPLGAIRNRRSLVALGNLVNLIETCLVHPAAANQTFLASDGHDLSTTELLERLGMALGRPARLVAVPPTVLTAAARFLGKRDLTQRLCGSLQVDIGKTRELLNWAPPLTVDEALLLTARSFLTDSPSDALR